MVAEGLALKDGDLARLFSDVDEGNLKMVLDPASPFSFTEGGVRSTQVAKVDTRS